MDENDNAPEFTNFPTEEVVITKVTEEGTLIASIAANDADEPNTNNSAVRYNMTEIGESKDSLFSYKPVESYNLRMCR